MSALSEILSDLCDSIEDAEDAMDIARALRALHEHLARSLAVEAARALEDTSHDYDAALSACGDWLDAATALAAEIDGAPGRKCGRVAETLATARDVLMEHENTPCVDIIGSAIDSLRRLGGHA